MKTYSMNVIWNKFGVMLRELSMVLYVVPMLDNPEAYFSRGVRTGEKYLLFRGLCLALCRIENILLYLLACEQGIIELNDAKQHLNTMKISVWDEYKQQGKDAGDELNIYTCECGQTYIDPLYKGFLHKCFICGKTFEFPVLNGE